LSPEAPYILEGFLSAGTSPEQQIDAIALRLIISQWAIAANGGTLWVEDQTDEQISIAFSLPVSTSP
jgi:signal transduction histidine kinase